MDPVGPELLHYKRARFETALPVRYLYTPAHYWIGPCESGVWRVGLTKFGSRMLGEMVDYGFEPVLNQPVASAEIIGWVEGFKAITDIVSLADGQFQGPNPVLETELTAINRDPYGTGWLYAVKGDASQNCLDVQAYAGVLDREIDKLLKQS